MDPSVLKEQENEVKPVGGRRMLSHSLRVLGKEVAVGLGVGSVQGTKLTPRVSTPPAFCYFRRGFSLCGSHRILFAAGTNEKQGTNERKANNLPKETSAFIISPMSRVYFLLFFLPPQGTETCQSSAELFELTLHVFCHLGFQK